MGRFEWFSIRRFFMNEACFRSRLFKADTVDSHSDKMETTGDLSATLSWVYRLLSTTGLRVILRLVLEEQGAFLFLRFQSEFVDIL